MRRPPLDAGQQQVLTASQAATASRNPFVEFDLPVAAAAARDSAPVGMWARRERDLDPVDIALDRHLLVGVHRRCRVVRQPVARAADETWPGTLAGLEGNRRQMRRASRSASSAAAFSRGSASSAERAASRSGCIEADPIKRIEAPGGEDRRRSSAAPRRERRGRSCPADEPDIMRIRRLLPLPPQLHHRLAEVDLGMAREASMRTPQPLDEDIVHAPAPAIHRDPDAGAAAPNATVAPGDGSDPREAGELAGTMSGAILRRRDRTARPPRVVHYSSAVNTHLYFVKMTGLSPAG